MMKLTKRDKALLLAARGQAHPLRTTQLRTAQRLVAAGLLNSCSPAVISGRGREAYLVTKQGREIDLSD